MVREHLNDVPASPLPDGYTIRSFRAGEEATWVKIQAATEPYRSIYPQLFTEQFGTDVKSVIERIVFLSDMNGIPVATGAAWFDDHFHDQHYGRLHWLAVVPEHQGIGLGKALVTTLCQRLKELGHTKAYLRTSTARISAIKLYLHFGFTPFPRSPEEERIWSTALRSL